MATIYDLKKEHEAALSELEFAEDDEQIHDVLLRIHGDVDKKLEFLTTILAEAITKSDISKEALRSATERLKKNKERDERTVNKLREFILSILVDFNISKFKGSLLNLTHQLTPGSLAFSENFDIEKLPPGLVTVVPEHKELNNKEIVQMLRDEIYRADLKKLDPSIAVVTSDLLPGVILERKESLTVR